MPHMPDEPRVLLLLPSATYRAPDFLAAARSLGVEVVVGSDAPQATDPEGERSLMVDLRRPEAAAARIVTFAQRHPLDAIIAVDDPGVPTAAIAAERLGLPHNPFFAAASTRDKAAMREVLSRAGIAQPEFRVAGPDDDVGALAGEVGWPVVIKPLCLSGSRGVLRADDPRQAVEAAQRCRRIIADAGEQASGPLLVERFVPGAEIAVEALLDDGRCEILAVFDKPDPLDGPYFEETLYVTPSRLPRALLTEVHQRTAAAAMALGLCEGPVHAEFRLPADGTPVLLELAARSIGGLCGRTLRFGLGLSLEELILRQALRLPVLDTRREHAASGVMMLPIPRRGLLRRVEGIEAARAVPGVTGVEITVPMGAEVVPLPEGDRYLGFVFARGMAPELVETALRAGAAALRFTIE